ncbi:MAG: antibiotic biosynthesis monooxygenase [Rhodospirillaceae bacterium]|nr:antibiotic biosynthesis monooxygenase [Rhodospirillaceae bacterium]
MQDLFAIIVTIKLKPGHADAFRPLILKNANAAVRDEADCHQFQVMNPMDDPDTFKFYEVYSDEAALDNHRQQPHFLEFVEATKDMVAEKTVLSCNVIKT